MVIDIEMVKNQLKEKSVLIDKEIEKYIPKKSIPNLCDGMWYAIGSGGKRIRPFLALETCRRLGGKEEHALPFAAACELLHNWLLVHDDIEDGDTVRRNQPAVWVKYGLGHGINIGDAMAQKVFEAVLACKDKGVDNETVFKLLKLITETAIKTSEGQAMEMNLRGKNDFTEEDYMEMVTHKTGYYLMCPMIGGAIIAGADDRIIKKILEYGNYIGPAFQIRDDIIDLTEGKGRGEIGCDIKEGKRSLIVAHTIKKCKKDEKKKLFEILNKPRKEKTKENVEWVIKLFEKYKSIERAQEKARELLKKSKNVIADLPKEVREGLEIIGEFIVERKT